MYACYAVSESACLRALLGEPRMLGMTPDTALVDLHAEETGAKLRDFLKKEATAWRSEDNSGDDSKDRELDSGRCAMLTVVAHKVPHGAVPVEPLYVKDDGTKVTCFAPCLKHFSGGFECGTRAHELGLEEALRKWQRRMEDETEGGTSTLYGTAPETFRMNYAVSAGEVARTFSSKA